MRLTVLGKLLLILVLLLSVALAGCTSTGEQQDQARNVSITLEVNPNPPHVGPGHLALTLTDAAGVPIDGASLAIEGTMAHAGMQPRRARARAGTDGKYETPFIWPMGGDWVLTAIATLPDGQEATREFGVTVAEEIETAEHGHGMEMETQGHDHGERIPNGGAAVRIVSPTDGALFEKGSDVRVEIEYDNFKLGEDGNHWHVYVDGKSARMIMGKMTEAVFRDLEPGQHEISTYLSVGSHEELRDGATVTITIVEQKSG